MRNGAEGWGIRTGISSGFGVSFLSFFYIQISLLEEEETCSKRFLLIQICDQRVIKNISCPKRFIIIPKPYLTTSSSVGVAQAPFSPKIHFAFLSPQCSAAHLITSPSISPHRNSKTCRRQTHTPEDPPINPPVITPQTKDTPSASPPPISPTTADIRTRALLHTGTSICVLRIGGRSLGN